MKRTLIAVGLAALALAPTAPTEAAFPGDNGRIIGTGGGAIYVMRPDGSDFHRLRNSKDTDGIPSYSPDGKRIVFGCRDTGATYEGEICVMRSDGTHRRLVTDEQGRGKDPDWSPDQQRVVFTGGPRRRHGIYTIRLDGSALKLIERDALYPAWSSRDRIAYTKGALYSSARDGSDEIVLAGGKGRCTFSDPDWAPSGRRLVFVRYCGEHGSSELLVIRANGSRQHRLGVIGRNPAWAPDGSRILYLGESGLRSVRPDGSGDRAIDTERELYFVDWQPRP